MPKAKYVNTEQINLRLPEGIYNDIIKIMEHEKKWSSPQQFIQYTLNEKIEKWKKDHTELTGHPWDEEKMKIEVTAKKYFAGLGYDGYSVKLPDGGMINLRLSKSVIDAPKPKELKVTLEWEDFND